MAQDDGRMQLKKSHDYFFQVQGQLAICGYDYCDFVCWKPHGMVVDRIKADPIFFEEMRKTLDHLFIATILPCILTGKSYETQAL